MLLSFVLFFVDDKLTTLYWLTKLHKSFIANSSPCSTSELSIHLTSFLTTIIKYCENVYERNGKNLVWSIKISGEVLNKLKSKDFSCI